MATTPKKKSKPFQPPWWCQNGHAQSVFGAFLKPALRQKLYRRRLELADGDFLDVDFLQGRDDAPTVVILHGLEGSSHSGYVVRLLSHLAKKQWKAAAVNLRGCSGEQNRLLETYHGGKSEEINYILNGLRERKGKDTIYIVGYSLGGNILLKWLGEQGTEAYRKVQKAVAISVPYDLEVAVDQLDTGICKWTYTQVLLLKLKLKLLQKRKQFKDYPHFQKAQFSFDFHGFDHYLTAPVNDFRSEKEYWRKSSSINYLKDICVPTLLIHAEDDPLYPAKYIPFDEIRASRFLNLKLLKKGGHLGFISGKWPWEMDSWMEKQITSFFSRL